MLINQNNIGGSGLPFYTYDKIFLKLKFSLYKF